MMGKQVLKRYTNRDTNIVVNICGSKKFIKVALRTKLSDNFDGRF